MKHQVILALTLKSSLKSYIAGAHYQWVFFLLHDDVLVSAESRPPGWYHVTSPPLQLFGSQWTHDPCEPGHGLCDD